MTNSYLIYRANNSSTTEYRRYVTPLFFQVFSSICLLNQILLNQWKLSVVAMTMKTIMSSNLQMYRCAKPGNCLLGLFVYFYCIFIHENKQVFASKGQAKLQGNCFSFPSKCLRISKYSNGY